MGSSRVQMATEAGARAEEGGGDNGERRCCSPPLRTFQGCITGGGRATPQWGYALIGHGVVTCRGEIMRWREGSTSGWLADGARALAHSSTHTPCSAPAQAACAGCALQQGKHHHSIVHVTTHTPSKHMPPPHQGAGPRTYRSPPVAT